MSSSRATQELVSVLTSLIITFTLLGWVIGIIFAEWVVLVSALVLLALVSFVLIGACAINWIISKL